MEKVLMSLAFLCSAVLLPWWVTIVFGVIALAYFRLYAVAIFGGVLMDLIFSIPEPRLFGFSYIYTAIFILLAVIAAYLERAILE